MGSVKAILTHHIYLSVKCLSMRILPYNGNYGDYIFQILKISKNFNVRKFKVTSN